MVHEMKLQEEYFNKIVSGEKIYEIRLYDEKRKLLTIGDVLVLKKEPELKQNIETRIEDLLYFNSFDELLKTLSPINIGFAGKTNAEIKAIYRAFYSEQDEKKYGVVAIKVKVI